jgi:hypothetical protein
MKRSNLLTLHHIASRNRISSSLLMAGSVIKEEKSLGITICLALKYINRAIDLSKQCIAIKPPLAISAR